MERTGKKTEIIQIIVLCMVMVFSVMVMLTLCADEGIDYDESYSFKSARDYTQLEIVQKMIDDHDTDVPLYYCALRAWNMLFGGIGHRFFSSRLFSVAGAVASMLLGILAVRRLWGFQTALYYMTAVGLAPALLHVNVNIRMYSWTNFLVAACAILAFCIVQNPERKLLWTLLVLCTVAALFSHYFTAFAFLAIYLYLLVALWRYERKAVWRVFVGGVIALAPLVLWIIVSGFFRFVKTDPEEVKMKKLSIDVLLTYLFETDMRFGVAMAVFLVIFALVGGALLMKNGTRRGERGFALMSIAAIFAVYLLALAVSSFASHFFSPRHIMHLAGLMWLGIAIVLPRVNLPVYLSGYAVLLAMCCSNYKGEYELTYRDTPYLEATKEFIETQMEAGDLVIYTTDSMYATLYSCYMPEQTFVKLNRLGDLDELAGRRVWFFSTNYQQYFSDEDVEKYGISEENMGHYGFQIMENNTDFDLLRIEIRGSGQ
ncbi:MAG: hypothetical protein NC092_07200 [Butyrivibrio sp.]|nr:hypothetical protein [Muribaculum sp.]MCM1552463.1 hypothetical protein [Butyrivibrio sp.]